MNGMPHDPESRGWLPLPRREELDEMARRTYDLLADPEGGSLAGLKGPAGIQLHSPALSARVRPVNLRSDAGIDPRMRESTVLVTARERYRLRAAHEDEARRAGVPGEVIEVVRAYASVEGLDGAEAAIVAFGREVFGEHRVSSEAYARLSSFFERRMKLVYLLGAYAMAATVAFDVQLPEGVLPGSPSRK